MSWLLKCKLFLLWREERGQTPYEKCLFFELITLWHVWTFPTWFKSCKMSGRTWSRRWAVLLSMGNKSRGADRERSRSRRGGAKCMLVFTTDHHTLSNPSPLGHSAVYIWACSSRDEFQRKLQMLASTCEHWDVQNQVCQHTQVNKKYLWMSWLKWSWSYIESFKEYINFSSDPARSDVLCLQLHH